MKLAYHVGLVQQESTVDSANSAVGERVFSLLMIDKLWHWRTT